MLGKQRLYQADLTGPLGRFREGFDGSKAVSVFRSAIGQEVVDRRPFPPDLTAEELAYRIRLPGATTRPVVHDVDLIGYVDDPIDETGVGTEPVVGPEPVVGSGPVVGPEPVVGSGPVVGPGPTVGPEPSVGPEPAVGSGPVVGPEPTVGPGPAEADPRAARFATWLEETSIEPGPGWPEPDPIDPAGRPPDGADDNIDARSRLLRDAAATLSGLAGIVVLILAVWPMTAGAVLDETGTPGPNVAIVAPDLGERSPDVAAQASMPVASSGTPAGTIPTEGPVSTVTPDGSVVDSPGQGPARTNDPRPRPAEPLANPAPRTPATPVPSPNPVVHPPVIGPTPDMPSATPGPPVPTAGPVVVPGPSFDPTPTSSPTPTPQAAPTPTPTPDPTPDPTPEPTPNPTPEPTPDPTPDPTPEPTPEPTPDPTPEPTPEPTPDL